MPLKPKFNKDNIIKKLNASIEIIEEEIIETLKIVGEKFIRNARIGGNYIDQTGNLRSSIGYVIVKRGEQLFDAFPGETAEGKANGLKVASEAAEGFPSGIVLIVVAGMEYAAAVESKGRDVLTASSFIAEADLKKALDELKQDLTSMNSL